MSRCAFILLAIVGVMACKHAHDVERGTAAQEPQAAPEVKQPGKQKAQARRPAYPGRPELSSTPEGLMQPGGASKLQRALAKRGYFVGQLTGKIDAATADALKRFQADEGLARTGAPDRTTVEHLGLAFDDVYRTPDSGQELKAPKPPVRPRPDSDPEELPNT